MRKDGKRGLFPIAPKELGPLKDCSVSVKNHYEHREGGEVREPAGNDKFSMSLLQRFVPMVIAGAIGFVPFAQAVSPIRFENHLIKNAIGKEIASDVIPGLPAGGGQQLHSSGCLLRGRVTCEMGMRSVSFVIVETARTRVRAVFLERNTGRRLSIPKPYGQPGMTDSPVWQIVDGFAFRDEQVLGKPVNTRKPFLEMLACELPGQPDVNIVAIGKVIYPVKGNFNITHLRPIYHAWRVDEVQQRFVEISTEGIECVTNSEGHD